MIRHLLTLWQRGFPSLASRILMFFLLLLVLVESLAFIALDRISRTQALTEIDADLTRSARAFIHLVETQTERLREATALLAGDFAFKSAYATLDQATLLSALQNHQQRIRADVLLLVSLEGEVLADTLHPQGSRGANCQTLIEVAETRDDLTASGIVYLEGQPYQMAMVPLLTPLPSAWIGVGFKVDGRLTEELRALIQSHVTLLGTEDNEDWMPLASTLPPGVPDALMLELGRVEWDFKQHLMLQVADETYVSWLVRMPGQGEALTPVIAVLQRALSEQLKGYYQLRIWLLFLGGMALLLSYLGGRWIARSLTRPLARLAQAAQRVERGDYAAQVQLQCRDEIGQLAGSFNAMVQGLAERDQVRSLLGKVVSRQVAEELLSKKVELGGEERVATVLFSDIRNFTPLAERCEPRALLVLLNEYLTEMSQIVEDEAGVIDKYIGDAIMALFGVPLAYSNDATQAVRAALRMEAALTQLNASLIQRGLQPLGIGIGINTGLLVAGNMGSQNRLNYTVIGDNVNLASRLESLTRQYGVNILLSEATQAAATEFSYCELDSVQVKGKQQAVRIYTPFATAVPEWVGWFQMLLAHYRQRAFSEALNLVQVLRTEGQAPTTLLNLYEQRCVQFLQAPPPPDWDGTTILSKK